MEGIYKGECNQGKGITMTPDQGFIAFSSISLAAVLLAFILAFRDMDIFSGRKLVSSLINKSPGQRSKDKHQQVLRKTQIADEAIAAKERGERFVPPSDYRGC
jgi:hypothetical protein